MDEEVIKRIMSPYPIQEEIVEQSTPVVSFGHYKEARVFTLGINPSNKEFENKNKELLKNNKRRLQTYSSLKLNSYTELTFDKTLKIFEWCQNYFDKETYYKTWFNKFNPILNSIGCSYFKPPYAAHVDLAQWATKKKWQELDKNQKEILINDGREFLQYQLKSENLEILLLNGKSVIDSFLEWSNLKVIKRFNFEIPKGKNSNIIIGLYDNRIKVIGWSVNLQSSFGLYNSDIERLAEKVKNLIDSDF